MSNNDASNIEVKVYKSYPLGEGILASAFVFCIIFINSFFIHHWALEAQKGEIREGLGRAAVVIATAINTARHDSYRHVEQMQSPEYKEDDMVLQRVVEAGAFIYAYTSILQDGKVYFILDGSPPGDVNKDGIEDSSDLMEVYADPSPDMLEVFETHKPKVSKEPYTDEWGSFISAFHPLFAPDGHFIGVLGVDVEAKSYFERLAPIERASYRAYVNGFFVAFMVGSIVWFLRKFIFVINASRLSIYDRFKEK